MTAATKRWFIQFGVRLISVTYIVLGVLGFLPFSFINPMHHGGIEAQYLQSLLTTSHGRS